jgi:hypothetical protein
MNSSGPYLVAIGLILSSQLVSAQDLSRYRAYALDSSLESVLAASEGRATDVRVLYQRPVMIQELEWRVPYTLAGKESIDPVRRIMFSFYDNALYQLLVSYDPDRTDGLSNGDIIASLTSTYGTPVLRSTRNRPLEAAPDTVVLAQWDSAGSSLTLLRGVYSPEFQLLLTSKASGTRARGAIREAARLAIVDAPRREQEQRKKEASDAAAARDKVRAANKAAFRP